MSSIDEFRGHDRLLRRMLLASQQFQKHLADRTGLNITDFSLIGTLEYAGHPMTAGALAQAADLTTGATTTAIDRLEKAGIVQRQRSEEDRRTVLVAIRQPQARKVLQQVEPLVEARRQLWAEFSEEESAAIVRFLKRNTEFAEGWNSSVKPDKG